MQSVLIFGRQPEIGLAEIESLYGADKITQLHPQAAVIDVDPCLLTFDRLGGAVKFCKLLTALETTDWTKILTFLTQTGPTHSETMPPGKMHLGISVIGMRDISPQRIQASGLTLKKAIQKTGRTVRLVPNNESELSTAQVIYNKLTSANGWELVIIRSGQKTYITQTIKTQDINAYARRDRERPKRDSRVGMLPPKLAQILVNLGSGILSEAHMQSICEIPVDAPVPRPDLQRTVLDPFCGTGVVLQEALLDGYHVYGTDLEPRMIEYTEANLAWLREQHQFHEVSQTLAAVDATHARWAGTIDFIASEVYLGRPFTSEPTPEVLAQTVSDCNRIISLFLKNIRPQLKPGARLCLAVPAWQIRPNTFRHLPLVDQIRELGYNQVRFEHVSESLIYYRSDQIVARELLVLTKISE